MPGVFLLLSHRHARGTHHGMTRRRIRPAGLAMVLAACLTAGCGFQRRIERGLDRPDQWLTYSGDYSGQRHSPLTDITRVNVPVLAEAWTFPVGELAPMEATPILYDGTLYFTAALNVAFAVDARTGRQIWRYDRELPDDLNLCCNASNRGLAIRGDRLFMETLDAHLLALDRHTGAVVFDVPMASVTRGYSGTAAPLVVGDLVIAGISGGEFVARGFIDAYDADTGEQRWRFWTVPPAGERGGNTWPGGDAVRAGGPTWLTGTYDPSLGLLYWGVGNPSPPFDGTSRPGDNLFTNAIVALDAATGELRWFRQFTPHDTHDWDSNQVPVLADLTIGGRRRHVVMLANRNGFFYVLDRTTGELLLAKPFVRTTWATEVDSEGRPILLPLPPTPDGGALVCPQDIGGTNFMSPSFDPERGLFFVTAREGCGVYYHHAVGTVVRGSRTMGGVAAGSDEPAYGALRALDARTGEMRWQVRYGSASWTGALSTAAGLVFTSDDRDRFMAIDADTGRVLWDAHVGENIRASPMTYALDGRQFVVLPSFTKLTAFALPAAD
jgi:alcohol dehydrogenase (cytochrome c)